jgi:hypothetical protein
VKTVDPLIIFWYLILPLIGFVSLIAVPLAFLLFYFKYFKPTARKLNKIIRRGDGIAFLAYDSGRVKIKPVTEITKQGVLKGELKEEYFIVPQFPLVAEEGKSNPGPVKEPPALSEVIAKRAILEDTGCPVFFGYAGKIVLLPPETLAYMEASRVAENIKELQRKARKEGELDLEKEKKHPIFLLDLRSIRQAVEKSFSNAQLISIMRDIEDELRAQLAGRRFSGSLIMIVVLLFVFLIVAKMMHLF